MKSLVFLALLLAGLVGCQPFPAPRQFHPLPGEVIIPPGNIIAWKESVCQVITPSGRGTGWGLSREGSETLVLTDAHVVIDHFGTDMAHADDPIWVKYTVEPKDYMVSAELIRYSDELDLAILRIVASNLRILPLVASKTLLPLVDDPVVAVGYPADIFPPMVSFGHVVSVSEHFLETSAPQWFGNSGCPIIHVRSGKVIGMAHWIRSRFDGYRSNSVYGFNWLRIRHFLEAK